MEDFRYLIIADPVHPFVKADGGIGVADPNLNLVPNLHGRYRLLQVENAVFGIDLLTASPSIPLTIGMPRSQLRVFTPASTTMYVPFRSY